MHPTGRDPTRCTAAGLWDGLVQMNFGQKLISACPWGCGLISTTGM